MKKENLCNSCNNKNIDWCDELKEYVMRGMYDCEWYSPKEKIEGCSRCLYSKLFNGNLYCVNLEKEKNNDAIASKDGVIVSKGLTGSIVKGTDCCPDFKPIEHKPESEKKVYIDPLVSKEEMASIIAEIKSESYIKISRLIQYLMEEYLVEDIQIEKIFEPTGEEYYKAKLKYREFPF